MASVNSLTLVNSCMCTNLRKVSRLITRVYDNRLKPSGININQLALLLTIDGLREEEKGAPSLSEIGESMAMDNSTLSRNLRVLENQDLVQLIPDPDKRTRKSVKITAKGELALQKAFPFWMEVQNEIQEKLGEKNFKEMIDLLHQLEVILRAFQ
ncbi:MAG: MarR family transcriptional regulator [Methanobacteriota archaeon]|nr:MAG: MarR family transcriptional regulator [Euryarchaeota archaeon]